jgi:hypothetical protein
MTDRYYTFVFFCFLGNIMFQNKPIKFFASLTLRISYLKSKLCWTCTDTMEIIETVNGHTVILLNTDQYKLFLNV